MWRRDDLDARTQFTIWKRKITGGKCRSRVYIRRFQIRIDKLQFVCGNWMRTHRRRNAVAHRCIFRVPFAYNVAFYRCIISFQLFLFYTILIQMWKSTVACIALAAHSTRSEPASSEEMTVVDISIVRKAKKNDSIRKNKILFYLLYSLLIVSGHMYLLAYEHTSIRHAEPLKK